jgi:hypothetical protein
MCSLFRNEYSNLKLAEATMGRDIESSTSTTRIGRDEPIEVEYI